MWLTALALLPLALLWLYGAVRVSAPFGVLASAVPRAVALRRGSGGPGGAVGPADAIPAVDRAIGACSSGAPSPRVETGRDWKRR
jgi:hypothetical protein